VWTGVPWLPRLKIPWEATPVQVRVLPSALTGNEACARCGRTDARLTLTSRGQRGTGGTTVATGARKRPPLRLSAHGGDDGAGHGMS